MSMTDVCRLCLTKDNLVWIFDKRFESSESMKDVIYITTGVEIHIKDIISQKICRKCCQVTIKMFEFRRTSLKNDKHLKDECKKHLKDNSIKIPNTDVIIKSDNKRKPDEVKNESRPENSKPMFKIHPSVRDLFRIHPQIKLPTVCLSSHITPHVSMPMDEVENYFKARRLDFNLHTKLALKSGRKVATKKTSTAPKPPNTSAANSSSSNNSTTTKMIYSKNKDNVIAPIKLKMSTINSVVKTSDNYIKDTDAASQSKIKDVTVKSVVKISDNIDLTKSQCRQETPEERASRKRKYPDNDETSKNHNKKPNFIESLGLTPKPNDHAATSFTESPSLSYVANTSVPLHICNMCNSVQYSAKDLRRHQTIKHLRCQFCKTKFRTLETKTKHIENTCVIKNMMKNLPDVQLKKIEYNSKARRKYPEAFIKFPPLKTTSGDKDESSDIKNMEETSRIKELVELRREEINSVKDTGRKDKSCASSLGRSKPDTIRKDTSRKNGSGKIKPDIARTPIDTGEIIEILSDDEESPSTSTTNVTGVDNLMKAVTNHNNSKTENNVEAATPNPQIPQSSITSAPSIPNLFAPIPENIVYNTVSIVKPDIKIKHSNLLESIEDTEPRLSDVKVLKELLKPKPLQLFTGRYTQTELPTNESITINRCDLTSELKKLKQQLYVYKIPIIIKSGNYNVTYNHQKESKQPKKLCLWSDLTPIDIKSIRLADPLPNITKQVISEKSNNQETSHGSPLPTNSNNNLTEIERSKNESQVINQKSNNETTSNPSILPSAAAIVPSSTTVLPSTTILPSSPTILPSSTTILPSATTILPSSTTILPSTTTILPSSTTTLPSSATTLPSSTTILPSSTTILPSTATYNFSGFQSLHPQVTATTSRFVCVNTTSVNSAFNAAPTTSIIDMNPMLNNILQPQNTSCVTETAISQPVCSSTVAKPPVSSSTVAKPPISSTVAKPPFSNTPIPLGLIRVKDVWELS